MSMQKILIIDDDTAIVESLKVLLDVKGFDTETAGDGLEGLIKAKSFCPDLILLDLLLPGKSGYLVLKELRENPATQKTPILVLSSFSEKPDMSHEPGLDDCLTPEMFVPKPVDPMKLLEKIGGLLRKT
jgi:DNA-binding response OmpR family regulator